jgi:TPR repeat protein
MQKEKHDPMNQNFLKDLKNSADKGDPESCHELADLYEWGDNIIDPDLEKAFDYYSKAKDLGSVSALICLGKFYLYGKYVKKNSKKAVDLFKKACKENVPVAYFYLGCCYSDGEGIKQDFKKGFEYTSKSLELGFEEAVFNLALFYDEGNYVKEDQEKAFKLYLKAAEFNLNKDKALIECAKRYEFGVGVKQSDKKALEFYEKGANTNSYLGLYTAGTIYEYGKFDVEADHKKAFKIYASIADDECPEAICAIGKMLQEGKGCKKDEAKAREYLLRSAALEYAPAMFNLGYYAARKDDFETAIQWYEKGAAKNHPDSLYRLGELYYFECDFEEEDENHRKAFHYLSKAAELEVSQAKFLLRRFYDHGIIVPQNPKRAFSLCEEAAIDLIDADFQLGLYCKDGLGTEKNLERAFEYFTTASEHNYPEALQMVGYCYMSGEGICRDGQKAIEYLKRAYDLGVELAAWNLYVIYSNGIDVPVMQSVAKHWHEKYLEMKEENKGRSSLAYQG